MPVQATLRLDLGDEQWETEILEEVSLNGLLARFDEHMTIEPGTSTRAELIIGETETGIGIEMVGEVVRNHAGLVALSIREIVGLEGLEHLRRLVRSNAAEPPEVELEFAGQFGIKSITEVEGT